MKLNVAARVVVLTGLLLGSVLLGSGCEKLKNTPVSLENAAIAGNWYAVQERQQNGYAIRDRLLLKVRADGYVSYHYLTCEYDGAVLKQQKDLALSFMPIVRLTSSKMVLQSFPLTQKFELTLGTWPDATHTVFEVDNMPLQRLAGDTVLDDSKWTCE